jgi:hypothetical protein
MYVVRYRSFLEAILEYHKVHMHERIPDSHWDIFRGSHWKLDRLIHQLQMQGSRDQGIMIQLIVDYLWHDAHNCSMIRELDQTSGCQSNKRWLEHLGHPSYQEDHQG